MTNTINNKIIHSYKDFLSFLRISYGSGAELETQLEISKRLLKTKELDYSKVDSILEEVMKMLNVMIRNMNPELKANEAKSYPPDTLTRVMRAGKLQAI